jgi:hypothetical protein
LKTNFKNSNLPKCFWSLEYYTSLTPNRIIKARLTPSLKSFHYYLVSPRWITRHLVFVFGSGGLPPMNVAWWWAPWISIAGTWNSLAQIGPRVFNVLRFGGYLVGGVWKK